MNPCRTRPLPWTGDYWDGLGNQITMLAYANPRRSTATNDSEPTVMASSRFNKNDRTITFECWPRFADVRQGDAAQFPGWPITVKWRDNDGRHVVGELPELTSTWGDRPVVQVIHEQTNEVLYTVRWPTNRVRLPVYAEGTYTVRLGQNSPGETTVGGLKIDAATP